MNISNNSIPEIGMNDRKMIFSILKHDMHMNKREKDGKRQQQENDNNLENDINLVKIEYYNNAPEIGIKYRKCQNGVFLYK